MLEATVDRNRLYKDEVLRLTLTVTDDESTSVPEMLLSSLPGDFPFQIIRRSAPSTSSQSSIQIINGKVTRSSTFTTSCTLLLKPLQTGRVQIPPLEITYGKEKLKSPAITVQVGENAAASQDSAGEVAGMPVFRQYLSHETTVMGAPVFLTYELLFPESLDLRQVSPSLPLDALQEDFRVEAPDLSQWSQKRMVQNGLPLVSASVSLRLIPRKPGKFALPGASIAYYSPARRNGTRRRGSAFFDDFFNDSPFFQDLQENWLTADGISLEVQDFPAEGRPDDFTGLLGPITATASVDLDDVLVGDPITLTLTLEGENLDEGNTFPVLKELRERESDFRLSGDEPPVWDESGRLTLSRTLRVLSPEVTEIPSFSLPYYDLRTKTYRKAETQPIPLRVKAVKKITLQDADRAPDTPHPLAEPSRPHTAIAATDGVVLNDDEDEILRRQWSPLGNGHGKPGLFWWISLPVCFWILCAALRWHLIRKNALSPAQQAARKAKSVLKHTLDGISLQDADAARRLGEALQEFLRQRLGIAGAVTAEDLQAAFQKKVTAHQKTAVSSDKTAALLELLAQCEAAQYGAGTTSPRDLKERILDAVKFL